MVTLVDASVVPCNLIIANETDRALELPLFPDNGNLVLEPEHQIIVKAEHSREYLFYFTTCKALGLTLAEAEESDGGEG